MTGMRTALAIIAFIAAVLFLGEFALQLLIAYQVHRTGQFHGISMQMGVTVRFAVICIFLTVLFAWLGWSLSDRESSKRVSN